ncbi:MAG: hypothetical protein HAW67_05315 [Endozoicomonadaceae bacterium]|nr:hypothetical protein [Endozoicomonadaceae bacterium]
MSTTEQEYRANLNANFAETIHARIDAMDNHKEFLNKVLENDCVGIKSEFSSIIHRWENDLFAKQKKVIQFIKDKAVEQYFWSANLNELTLAQAIVAHAPCDLATIEGDDYQALTDYDVYLWLFDHYYQFIIKAETRLTAGGIKPDNLKTLSGLLVVKQVLSKMLRIKV